MIIVLRLEAVLIQYLCSKADYEEQEVIEPGILSFCYYAII